MERSTEESRFEIKIFTFEDLSRGGNGSTLDSKAELRDDSYMYVRPRY